MNQDLVLEHGMVLTDVYLEHFGVKGMKWGIRNFARSIGRGSKAAYGGSRNLARFIDGRRPYVTQDRIDIAKKIVKGTAIAAAILFMLKGLPGNQLERFSLGPVNPGFLDRSPRPIPTAAEIRRQSGGASWSDSDGAYLAHFGVRGMRWGIRKKQEHRGLKLGARIAIGTALVTAYLAAMGGLLPGSQIGEIEIGGKALGDIYKESERQAWAREKAAGLR